MKLRRWILQKICRALYNPEPEFNMETDIINFPDSPIQLEKREFLHEALTLIEKELNNPNTNKDYLLRVYKKLQEFLLSLEKQIDEVVVLNEHKIKQIRNPNSFKGDY